MVHGPFERSLIIVERRVKVNARGEPVLIQVANDAHDLYVSRAEFGRELAAFLVLLWLALSIATWAQVAIGLRSLKRLGAEVLSLKRRPDERLLGHYPNEISPLTMRSTSLRTRARRTCAGRGNARRILRTP